VFGVPMMLIFSRPPEMSIMLWLQRHKTFMPGICKYIRNHITNLCLVSWGQEEIHPEE
jgi:hypothetical protein